MSWFTRGNAGMLVPCILTALSGQGSKWLRLDTSSQTPLGRASSQQLPLLPSGKTRPVKEHSNEAKECQFEKITKLKDTQLKLKKKEGNKSRSENIKMRKIRLKCGNSFWKDWECKKYHSLARVSWGHQHTLDKPERDSRRKSTTPEGNIFRRCLSR